MRYLVDNRLCVCYNKQENVQFETVAAIFCKNNLIIHRNIWKTPPESAPLSSAPFLKAGYAPEYVPPGYTF